jgi:ATP-binding cassette subfamily B protein
MLRLAAEQPRRLLLGTLFVFLSSALTLVYPLIARAVIDEIAGGAALVRLERLCLVMLAILLAESVCICLRQYFMDVAAAAATLRLRRRLYEHLLQREQAFFDHERTGELLGRLSADVTVLQEAIHSVSGAGCNVLRIVGGVGLLFYTSTTLSWWLLLTVVPTGLGVRWAAGRIRSLSRESQDALAAASHAAQETLNGIQTVRLFGREDFESRRYGSLLARAFEAARRRSVAAGALDGWTNLSVEGCAIVVLLVGGRAVGRHELTLGAIVAFAVIAGLVAAAVKSLTSFVADAQRALGSSERVFELLAQAGAAPAPAGAAPAAGPGRVELQGVSFRYAARPDVTVLDGVDLTILPGERLALVGASGAGKSTLARLLTRLYEPSRGRVVLDGADISRLDLAALRRLIAVVPQEPVLFSTSVAENIRYARDDASDAEVAAAASAAMCDEFLTRLPLGLLTQVGDRGVQLSGGQRQRVAIARALLRAPRLLILDEATSALDSANEALVREAFERVMRDRTTLLIAHRLSTVSSADRVVVLQNGRVVQVGSHSTLLREGGVYRQLVDRQLAG